jgi:ATP-dependent Clp protease ATP-binding subunit ClpB
MEIDSSPEEIDKLQRQVDRLKMEELALAKETDPASVERLEKLRADLADREEELRALRSRWDLEKANLDRIGDLKIRVDELRNIADRAIRDGDLEQAARIQYGELPELERELESAGGTEGGMVSEEVTAEDVAEVVGAWTGIPAGRLMEGETEKLLRMEEELGKRVIGQDEAVRAVSDAVRRTRAGIADPDRPTGSFLFLGPTGVGKTELAKALAEFLFDDERAMIRIDMSEYSEKHSVARLVGAPPGYVGYEEGGQLTEAVRRRPYSLVLLDEVEKAHPEVFDILLQVLDDGRLTDGQGRTVDFRNTILVLTSNMGSQFLIEQTVPFEQRQEQVMAVVRQSFKPEFLNRLDDVVMFQPLQPSELEQIVDLQVQAMQSRLDSRRITLEVTPAAKSWLANHGFDPIYGARPLRRLVQKEIGDQLARAILSGDVRDGQTVTVDEVEDTLILV